MCIWNMLVAKLVFNKNEVEHLSQLKCKPGTPKIADIIPENGLFWHDYAKSIGRLIKEYIDNKVCKSN